MEYKPKAAEKKKIVVKQFVDLIKEYPIVGAVNMLNLPAAQLYRIRSQLRGKAEILMTKRRLMKIAFDQAKKDNVGDLVHHLEGMPALIFTKENPFTLYKTIQKNKSKAPAKAGQIAPNDISVQEGPTPFAPGPVIGELGKAGIKAGIDGGKVVIKESKVVVKKGEPVSALLASLLSRLGVEPMEIGLDLVAVWEKGTIFQKDVLAIDEDAYVNNIKTSWQEALNLAVFAGYPTSDSVELMIKKAHNDARAISLSQNIPTKETIKEILALAESQGKSLKTKANWEG